MKSLLLASLLGAPLLFSQANSPAPAAQPASTSQAVAPRTDSSADESREIWDTGFLKKRPSSAQPSAHTHRIVHYAAAVPDGQPVPHRSQAAIGLTIWRLRTPTPADREGSRLLVPELKRKGNAGELVPERIDSATVLHADDYIRLSIEVPRSGFLYVIDRERYNDGTFGDPVLIFPLLSINQGNNEVHPGRVIEIPPQNSDVLALHVTRSSDQHIGEDLMLLVTPQRLAGITLTKEAQPLDASLVTRWDRDWSTSSLALNLVEGQHQTWSTAEQRAGALSGPLLTQADPLPQTIVSVPPHNEAHPMLIHLPLLVQQ